MFTKLKEAVVHSTAFTDLEFLSKKKMILCVKYVFVACFQQQCPCVLRIQGLAWLGGSILHVQIQ